MTFLKLLEASRGLAASNKYSRRTPKTVSEHKKSCKKMKLIPVLLAQAFAHRGWILNLINQNLKNLS